MANFITITPRDDLTSRQSSDWCTKLAATFVAAGHAHLKDVNDTTPPTTKRITKALGQRPNLALYFGHGDDGSWRCNNRKVIDASHLPNSASTAVVSIACNTGNRFGSDAITAGVGAWLGFTVLVGLVPPHKNRDPIGDAVVRGLSALTSGGSVQDARDALEREFDQLKIDFEKGSLRTHPSAAPGYFIAVALRDHVVVHGSAGICPLV